MSDSVSIATIEEITQGKDRRIGFRGVMFTREDGDSRCLISITVSRAVNMAPYDEAPHFCPMSGNVESNVTLAECLTRIAAALLDRPRSDSLPPGMLLLPGALTPPEPAPPAFTSDPPPCCA